METTQQRSALTPAERAQARDGIRLWIRSTPGNGSEPLRLATFRRGSDLSRRFELWLHRRFKLDSHLDAYVHAAGDGTPYQRQRAALAVRLHLVDDLTQDDVATRLHCDRSTVRRDLARVLDWLVTRFEAWAAHTARVNAPNAP